MDETEMISNAQFEHEAALIKLYTGKSVDEVFNEYDLRQLIKLNAYLVFIKYI